MPFYVINPMQSIVRIRLGSPLQELNVLIDLNTNGLFIFDEAIPNLNNGYYDPTKSSSALRVDAKTSYSNFAVDFEGQNVTDQLVVGP